MGQTEAQSDIAALWDEALNTYAETSNVPIRSILASQKTVATILMQQQHELDTFKQFRHNKSKLDKLRTLCASNADYIQAAANQIAGAASTSFPPSSAILTAFTYVLTASKHVSDDYNIIESFFDVMHCFLRRLSLLEGRIPPRKEFHQDLIAVFSSVLSLSGLAYSYCNKGRFRHWASALVDGKDPKLKFAYEGLNENLKRLESATMIQTLRTAIDIHDEAKFTKENLKTIQVSIDQNIALTERTSSGVTELLHHNQEILRLVRKQSQDVAGKQRQLKSHASRPANFARLRQLLDTAAVEVAMHSRLQELERETLARVFDWVQKEPAFLDIIGQVDNLCWVSGDSGMGKSTMAFKMFRHLKETFAHDDAIHVACFFFDSTDPKMSSAKNMVRWCAVQVAERDARYCESVLRDLRQDAFQSNDEAEDIEKEWLQLIERKHSADSKTRLILVLDGIDEAEEGHFRKLLDILGSAKDERGHKIQIVATCDPDHKLALPSILEKRIELTKDKIGDDIRRLASSQVKTQPRLRKLRSGFRRFLVRKVIASADSFVYIVHTMRRLNAIGHEGPIRKELGKLPAKTTALYELLLADCQKNRSSEDREVLRHLLAWLAYAKSRISMGEASLLIDIIKKGNSVSIDEAFDGPLGRLLRISSSGDGEDLENDHSQSDTDTPNLNGDSENEANVTEEAAHFVDFQERSLRTFFRQAMDDPQGLRCNSTEAQLIIFKIIAAILLLESDYNAYVLIYPPENCSSDLIRLGGLKRYAATWIFAHLLEIDIDNTSDEIFGPALECLFNILNNKNGCLKIIEAVTSDSVILQGKEAEENQVLTTIESWAKRAVCMPPTYLSEHAQKFFQSVAIEPRRVFVVLARAHVNNWFTSANVGTALCAFECAHHSLLKSKELPELRQINSLKDYFQLFDSVDHKITAESAIAVFDAFEDIEKTPASYLGIAMAMYGLELYEEAVKQCNVGLSLSVAVADSDHAGLYQCKGLALLEEADLNASESKRMQYFREALLALGSGIEMHRILELKNELRKDDRTTIAFTLTAHAYAAAALGKFDLMLESVRQATESTFWSGGSNADGLIKIVAALAKANQYHKVIEVLQAISRGDLADLLLDAVFKKPKTMVAIHEAAQRSNLGQCLLSLYNAASKYLSTTLSLYNAESKYLSTTLWTHVNAIAIPGLHIMAAMFAREALHDTATAKLLLSETVYSARAHFHMVEQAAYLLSELLLEDFRLSGDPHAKAVALKETRALQERLTETMGADFCVSESPIAVVLGLMLKAMGPALERADVLRGAFSAAVKLLTDGTGYNDKMALRHLTRVLACVTSLEREAQIAMTAQLYVLDRDVREKDLAEQRWRSQEGNGDAEPAPASTEHPSASDVMDEMAMGLLEGAYFECNDCSKIISDWSHGDVYMCVYCADCDMCEDCFSKKLTNEKGVTTTAWRFVCPEGHRHVKAPVEGWKGVRDGILRVEDNEIPFRDWLKDLEMKWDAYWDRYWAAGLE